MSITQINSIMMHMEHQLATLRMAGAIKQSTDVMKSMQTLIKVPEIMQTMRAMSRELTAAGIMGEMIEETMEAIEPEELEEQAAVSLDSSQKITNCCVQEEVENILYEITQGELGKAPLAVKDKLGPSSVADKRAAAEAEQLIDRLQSMKH